MSKARYSKHEFAKRGDALFEDQIRPHLKKQDQGKYVAIDIETGTYTIDESELRASAQLKQQQPDAQIWLRRIGSRYVRHFAPRFR